MLPRRRLQVRNLCQVAEPLREAHLQPPSEQVAPAELRVAARLSARIEIGRLGGPRRSASAAQLGGGLAAPPARRCRLELCEDRVGGRRAERNGEGDGGVERGVHRGQVGVVERHADGNLVAVSWTCHGRVMDGPMRRRRRDRSVRVARPAPNRGGEPA